MAHYFNTSVKQFLTSFGLNVSDEELLTLFMPVSINLRFKALLARMQPAFNSPEFDEVVSQLSHLDGPDGCGERLAFFLLEQRKSTRVRTSSVHANGSTPGIAYVSPQVLTNSHTVTSGSPDDVAFDRRSQSRSRIGRTNSNVMALNQGTPVIERRIPRPKERRATEMSGTPTSMSSYEHSSFNDDSSNKMEGSKSRVFVTSRRDASAHSAENRLFENGRSPTAVPPLLPSNEQIFPRREVINRNDYNDLRSEKSQVPLEMVLIETGRAMQGFSGSYIRANGRRLELKPTSLSITVQCFIEDVISIGNMCLALPSVEASNSADLFQKAFQNGIVQQRRKFVREADQYIKMSAKKTPQRIMFELKRFTHQWRSKLQVLVDLWLRCGETRIEGHEVLQTLLELRAAEPQTSQVFDCIDCLIGELALIYVRLLRDWIVNTRLQPNAGRWLIRVYENAQNDVMGKYRMDRVLRRFRFYSGDMMLDRKILELGRIVGCLGGSDWDGWDVVREKMNGIVPEHIIDYNSSTLVDAVHELYALAGRDVIRTLVERDSLFKHLTAASTLYFLLDEHFSRRLYNSIKTISANFSREISAGESAMAAFQAAVACGIVPDQLRSGKAPSCIEVYAEMGNTPRESIRRNYIDAFHLRYSAATGLAACVFSRDALLRYGAIFKVVWSIQFVYQGITFALENQAILSREIKRQRMKVLLPMMRSWSVLLSHLHSVFFSLADYAFETCKTSLEAVRRRLEKAGDLADCIRLHDRHLGHIEEVLFMNVKNGNDVGVRLVLLYDNAIAIMQEYERFSAELRGRIEFWPPAVPTSKHIAIEDTADFVAQEAIAEREAEMLAMHKRQHTALIDLYSKFKSAQAQLDEGLHFFTDQEPMAGLRGSLLLSKGSLGPPTLFRG